MCVLGGVSLWGLWVFLLRKFERFCAGSQEVSIVQ